MKEKIFTATYYFASFYTSSYEGAKLYTRMCEEAAISSQDEFCTDFTKKASYHTVEFKELLFEENNYNLFLTPG